uniref:Uncharacterized protein n=1 Tax=Vannella robusta TaxID=1487602 RepID=A0A7S4MJV8_9EUKA|mmetsp:Transcript_24726/g.31466  ORF Transcript_24726/g.31466 Transcript_24726/m.31466 type:complete len:289 (+) Transcript_24726:185-1051(+)
MLGDTKLQVPLEKVESLTLGEPSVSQAIHVKTSDEQYNFINFQQDIEEEFKTIENVWTQTKVTAPEPEKEVKEDTNTSETAEETETSQPPTKEETTRDVAVPEASVIKKRPSTSSIREQMRQRQAKAQAQREQSEAKIKAKASVSRQKIEEKKNVSAATNQAGDSFADVIRFAMQFAKTFVILWVCSFVIPNYLTIETWRSHLASSALLASLKTSLNLEGVARACVPLIAAHIPSVAEHFLAMGCLCVLRCILLLFTCFVIPDFHIGGIIGIILVLGVTSIGEIVRAK